MSDWVCPRRGGLLPARQIRLPNLSRSPMSRRAMEQDVGGNEPAAAPATTQDPAPILVTPNTSRFRPVADAPGAARTAASNSARICHGWACVMAASASRRPLGSSPASGQRSGGSPRTVRRPRSPEPRPVPPARLSGAEATAERPVAIAIRQLGYRHRPFGVTELDGGGWKTCTCLDVRGSTARSTCSWRSSLRPACTWTGNVPVTDHRAGHAVAIL